MVFVYIQLDDIFFHLNSLSIFHSSWRKIYCIAVWWQLQFEFRMLIPLQACLLQHFAECISKFIQLWLCKFIVCLPSCLVVHDNAIDLSLCYMRSVRLYHGWAAQLFSYSCVTIQGLKVLCNEFLKTELTLVFSIFTWRKPTCVPQNFILAYWW